MDVRTTLRADADSAAAARRFIADVLWQRGFSHPGIEDAVLLTSEAVTDAVARAGTEVGLVVVADAFMARVEVHDGIPASPVNPALRQEDSDALGLIVIDALAEAWGVRRLESGKCIWFEVRS